MASYRYITTLIAKYIPAALGQTCSLGHIERETIEHLLVECNEVTVIHDFIRDTLELPFRGEG